MRQPIQTVTREAGPAILANLCVKVNTSGVLVVCVVDDIAFLGVTPEDGETVTPFATLVDTAGIVQIQSNGAGAIDEGDVLVCAAAGQVKVRAPADGTSHRMAVGTALAPAAATAGLLVDVMLCNYHWIGA